MTLKAIEDMVNWCEQTNAGRLLWDGIGESVVFDMISLILPMLASDFE